MSEQVAKLATMTECPDMLSEIKVCVEAIKGLENDMALLTTDYQALQEQHQQVQHEHENLQDALQDTEQELDSLRSRIQDLI